MRKYITIVLAIVLLAGAFGISKMLSSQKELIMKPRTVSIPLAFVKQVENVDMSVIIPASGSLVARNKIQLFSEVQGILEINNKEFKAGVSFKKGEVLYKLNSDEFYTSLLAQRSSFQNLILSMMADLRLDYKESYEQWQTYLDNFDIRNSLNKLPEAKTNVEKHFIAAKNIYTNFYTIKNLEFRLDKYTIKAPFDGVLTEASVTPGSLVSPGQLLGEFVNPTVYELEVAINSKLVQKLNVGDKVEVHDLEDDTEHYSGTILRINKKIDLSSQTVNVFIALKGDNLKEGKYLKAFLQSKELTNIMEIPRNLLTSQNQVYIIKDSLLRLANIELIHQNDQSIVVRGLKDSDYLLMKPVPKAFDGMKVMPKAQKSEITKEL